LKNRILYIGIGVITIMIFTYYLGWSLAPGSYARAERYEFDIPEKNLIEIIKEIKEENKELNAEHRGYYEHNNKHWYFIYFYYPEKKQIISTYTRPKTKLVTTFAFVGYKKENDVGNWTTANKYFWWWKNSQAKTDFKTRILKKLENKIKKRKPNKELC
jgi:hypothetical protein